MHLNIYLESVDELNLPLHYNHLVHSAIYNSIDAELADFLHNEG